jgi:hypothetical protein
MLPDSTKTFAMTLMLVGGALLVLGGLLWFGGKLGIPLGRLPGDIHAQGKGWSFSFPIVTCIVLSLLLTILLNVFRR